MKEENSKNENKKTDIAQKEEEILRFWQENNIFEKSLEKESPKGEFIFFDGPPFATGIPHHGHILASTIKDTIPRFKTMQGYFVPRKWGWDCHGLPLENLIEKELGLKTKKDIEEYGIEKFNNKAKDEVLRYADVWEKFIPRIGRWVDMDNDYRTMDTSYSESVWWVFKSLYEKGLVYKGFKSMHMCPRCGTTLSNFEVNQGYKDIEDISVYAKFKLKDEGNTFFLAWTTTPWTLPGNVALAVNLEIDYAKVSIKKEKSEEFYILAKEKIEEVFSEENFEIKEDLKGEDLVGLFYEPLFDYYKDSNFIEEGKSWRVYAGDFVSTEEGAGIVHIAPAFGEEDLELSKEIGFKPIHHIDEEGKFKSEVKDFAGLPVKPKENHQETDKKILELLENKGLVFKTEVIEHSYPHCWRCHTPLLNYATDSWFVEVTKFREKLVSENKKISWVPKEIGSGRMGNWLEGVRDWAISRSRYWGAPLPVWQDEAGEETFVAGSVKEIKERTPKSGNKYFVMRHGEAESNVKRVISSVVSNEHHLTEKGKEQVREKAKNLKKEGIEMIFYSPFVRTRETADILANELSVPKEKLVEDARIGEIGGGELEEKSVDEYHNLFKSLFEKFDKKPKEVENLNEVKRRVGEFFSEINQKYKDKKILIVTHQYPFWMTLCASSGLNKKEAVKIKEKSEGDYPENAEVEEFEFLNIPRNRDYELDLHRPYIDEVKILDKNGKEMKRVPEVFDCWFESGSMPYGQKHYPFENLEEFDPEKSKGFPADFIAEGLDQTRGWFYSLLVLSTALFGESSYKNVIVNGMALGEDGKKMSKSLGNFASPSYIVDNYGADSLRYYMLASPLMKAGEYAVAEDGIKEISNKLIKRLSNVISFYETYSAEVKEKEIKEFDFGILDKWMISKLYELIEKVTQSMEKYELDKATRPILDFVDDLSTWYLRRSRERLKGDGKEKENAAFVLGNVLGTISRIIAPFTPFFAEVVWKRLGMDEKTESVHLSNWPNFEEVGDSWIKENFSAEAISKMEEARDVVSKALEMRSEAGIKVRQPLQSISLKKKKLEEENDLKEIIKAEVNVKEVLFDPSLEDEVSLDFNITEELKREGIAREIVRKLQDMRKKAGFNPKDEVLLKVKASDSGKEIIEEFKEIIKEKPLIKSASFKEEIQNGENLEIEGFSFEFEISK